MKKFLLHILLFFAIVGIVDVGIGFCGRYLRGHAKGGITRQFDDLVMKDKHDMLVLGSSRAHSHYDTSFLSDTLGFDVYNAGYEGNGVILSYGIVDLVLKRYTPRIVLFDVEPAFDIIVYQPDNKDIRYINLLKPYYRENDIPEIIKGVSREEWNKVLSGMIRYNTNILRMLVDNVINRGIEKCGYAPLNGRIEKDPEQKHQKSEEYIIDELKLAFMEKLIDQCQSHNVSLIFVASPKYGKNTSILEPVKQLAEKKGVRFLDYYNDSTFMAHKEWFKEPMHLNKEGARFFSRMMVPEIEKLLNNNGNRQKDIR